MKEKNVTQNPYVPPHVSARYFAERDVLTDSVLDADPTTNANVFDNVGGDIDGEWH